MPARTRLPLQAIHHVRALEVAAVAITKGIIRILGALPSRWVLRSADGLGAVLSVLNGRARRIAHQNLAAVFGPDLTRSERRRIFRNSYKNIVRSVLLLCHLHPLSAKRYRRWVEVASDLEHQDSVRRLVTTGGVLVSCHLGNWELLLGLRIVYPHLPRATFLAEAVPHEAVNDLLVEMRGHGDLLTARRRGGARLAARTVAAGGIAALLIDRNVRGVHGGIYAPFLGIEARTTPLPTWLAEKYDCPVHPIACLPTPDGRYRIWVGPDATADLPDGEPEARAREILRRLHARFEVFIREDPTLWHWGLKRFKSRPHAEPGRHPAYSLHDP